jgi:hypothetical protein
MSLIAVSSSLGEMSKEANRITRALINLRRTIRMHRALDKTKPYNNKKAREKKIFKKKMN